MPNTIEFLACASHVSTDSLREKLIAWRMALGLSQGNMATTLGVDPTTLAAWVGGRHCTRLSQRPIVAALSS